MQFSIGSTYLGMLFIIHQLSRPYSILFVSQYCQLWFSGFILLDGFNDLYYRVQLMVGHIVGNLYRESIGQGVRRQSLKGSGFGKNHSS